MLKQLSKYGLMALTYLGAFSRLTHGRYTPCFYQYQLERAPDDSSLIPLMDLTLGTLLAFEKTRAAAAGLCTVFQTIGVVLQLKKGGQAWTDSAGASLALLVFLS